MLTRLLISNVVLIEKLELDFSSGLTIFSGETGAGKSILLESLGFILGARAETDMIRPNADKMSVTGVFDISNTQNPVADILRENEILLEKNEDIIIKRSLDKSGKSKILINDTPASLKLLRQICLYLVEIHGQFDSQGLLDSSTHIDVLDCFGAHQNELLTVKNNFNALKNIEKRLNDALFLNAQNVQEEQTLLHYKTELENINVQKGEEETLSQKRAEAMMGEKLVENFNAAYGALEGQGLASNIRHALSALDKINRLTNDKYQNISKTLDGALVELDEATAQIEKASSEISLNANETDAIEERLFALKALARKHACSVDDLPDVLSAINQKLSSIEQNGDEVIRLQKEMVCAKEAYLQSAMTLRQKRLTAAKLLETSVQGELSFLRLEKARFRVRIESLDEAHFGEKGADSVVFEVSTNTGQPFGALNKIASGGELARFMLALKVHLAQNTGVGTLIFDEIDSGVGGSAAEAVGNRLSKLSKTVQVMAVTHSPQVAAFSDTHFKVSKKTVDQTTITEVYKLSQLEKKEEIARMISGEKISNEARAAADILIKPAS